MRYALKKIAVELPKRKWLLNAHAHPGSRQDASPAARPGRRNDEFAPWQGIPRCRYRI